MNGSIWMIGDVQGCCSPLDRLLSHPELAGDPHSRLWFAGDLVNRGPDSLATLRRIIDLGDRVTAVLGNHDLHLLAAAAGVRKPSKSDTLEDILRAPDAAALIDWLRFRPLAHFEQNHLMVHAGTLAKWDVAKTLALAGEVQDAARAELAKALQKMYGNEPATWKEDHTGGKRMRVIINALTRIRLCTPNGHMEFATKVAPGCLAAQPDALVRRAQSRHARRHHRIRPLVHAGPAAAPRRDLPGHRLRLGRRADRAAPAGPQAGAGEVLALPGSEFGLNPGRRPRRRLVPQDTLVCCPVGTSA